MMNKYVLITGASSGIGYHFAKEFDLLGYNTILVARREDRLKELASQLKNNSIIYPYDLKNKDNCEKLITEIKKYNIEIFINNAGFGDLNLFNEMDINKAMDMIDINNKSLTFLLHGVLNQFIESNNGIIINVSSIAGLLPAGPYMSVYYATKAYVTSLTRAVAYEIKNKYNIKVKALCPGPVDTEFNRVANSKFNLKSITPERCVKYTIKKLKNNKIILTPTLGVRITELFSRFIPTNLLLYLCSKNQQKKK